jgi:hypothetical protein
MDRFTRIDSGVHRAHPLLGRSAQLAVTWAVAAGGAGGGLVAALLLAGRMHPEAGITVGALLATVGSMLGAVHGSVLGYLGRPESDIHATSWTERAFAMVVAAGALIGAITLALWLVLSALVVRAGSAWGWVAFTAAAALGLVFALQATLLGWRSLDTAYARWPEHRLGTLLVLGAFGVLCAVFLALRPAIPGTQLQLSAIAWIFVAALATLWIATPVIVIALRLVGRPQWHIAR